MTRDVLTKILARAPGVEGKDDAYEVGAEHHLTFYLGDPGRAMAIADVQRLGLSEEFVELVTRETGTSVYVEYGAIHAISTRPPKPLHDRRAGFA